MNKFTIFCDFDGTITREDTIDKFLETFASDKWLHYEQLWKNGEIGSRECLYNQIKCVEQVSEASMFNFITRMRLDPGFMAFIEHIKRNHIKLYIVSDGFKYFINRILEIHSVNNIPIYSNDLINNNGQFEAIFPYFNELCNNKSGMCKCKIINSKHTDKKIVYIGDGKSDFCAVKNADIVFAKGSLATYCKNNGINFIPFINFFNIINYLNKEDFINAEYIANTG